MGMRPDENKPKCDWAARFRLNQLSGQEIEVTECTNQPTHQEVDNPNIRFCSKHAASAADAGIEVEPIPSSQSKA